MDSPIFWIEVEQLAAIEEHPICAFVPGSAGVSARNGAIIEPAVFFNNKLLDGRARVREAMSLGLRVPARNIREDEHPVIFVANATRDRDISTPQRAVMAVRLMRLVTDARPEWLTRYDRGLASRLRTGAGREAFVKACGISMRTYQRVQGITDEGILQAVAEEHISLRLAEALRSLTPRTLRRIFALPPEEQAQAITNALARSKGRGQMSLLDEEQNDRGKRVVDWRLMHELAHVTAQEHLARGYARGLAIARAYHKETTMQQHKPENASDLEQE
ncbi:hypothetical protein [Paraburkholderia silvatlantica]|uniref:hypothetical protein n=1 Tax=Paraburkholderia silvatlantica TaxID=321895 RepID=UPI003752E06D